VPSGCFLNTAQGALPAAANSVSVTSGAIDTNGAYSQIAAAAPADLAISGVVWTPSSGFNEDASVVIRIAQGAAASEVDIASFVGFNNMISTVWTPDPHGAFTPAKIPNESVTSGTRIAARIQYGDAAESFAVAVTYVGIPLAGDMETTASDLTGTLLNSLTSGSSSYANGSWTQLTASTSAAWVVNHFATGVGPATAGSAEIAIGTGAAASEVEISAFSTQAVGGYLPRTDALGLLLDNIAASTRVALRMRHAAASAQTVQALIGYYLKPL